MRNYRAFILGDDGHVIDRVDLPDCDDDETAKHKARKLAIGQAVELWDGPRKIATFQPTNPES